MSDELHHILRVDRIGASGYTVTVSANAAECLALAGRMQIPGVLSFACAFTLRPAPGEAFSASGHLRARVVQTCIVTLEDFEADVDERFTIRFVPAGTEAEAIDVDSDDELPYAADVIDLGDAAAEQLALSLDPYPRAPGAELPPEAGDDEGGPFASLRR